MRWESLDRFARASRAARPGLARRDERALATLLGRGTTQSKALERTNVYYTLHNVMFSLHCEQPDRSGPARVDHRLNAGRIVGDIRDIAFCMRTEDVYDNVKVEEKMGPSRG